MAEEDFDEILIKLRFGRWNWLHMIGFSFVHLAAPSFVFAGAFIAPSVTFNCTTEADDQIAGFQDQCVYKVFENSTLGEELEVEKQCTSWCYGASDFITTLTSEFNLVCGDAYLRPTYQTLYMAGNLIGSLLNGFLADKFMDESPRWLIVSGDHAKALKVLKKASKWNNSPLPADKALLERMVVIQKLSNKNEEKEKRTASSFSSKCKGGLKQITILCRTPELCRRTLLTYVVWIVSSTVYYGLSLNAINFELDPFIYMVVGGATEIPAYSVVVPVIAKAGRVHPTTASYYVCGITILLLAFIPSDPKWIVITLAMIGKFCISAAYQIIFLMASEMFPTEVRMKALGTSCFVSAVGGIAAPYITDLAATSSFVLGPPGFYRRLLLKCHLHIENSASCGIC